MDFLAGGLAAACAGFLTNPLEVLKVRMQLQGELKKKGEHPIYYKNIFHAGYVIVKNDGVLALQKGLVSALWVQLIMNGLRLGTYQLIDSKGYIRDSGGNLLFYKSVMAAGFCGILGQLCASPLYLIKTHIQAQAAKSIAVGYQHQHTGTLMALKTVYNEHGIKGLFRGATAVIPRSFIASASQLTTFMYTKEKLTKYNISKDSLYLKAFLSSMISGIVISIMVSPFDLVLIRLYNQGVNAQGQGLLYKNYLDCIMKIYKSEGIRGFYKGLGTIYVRLGPHTLLCLLFWDIFKDIHQQHWQKALSD